MALMERVAAETLILTTNITALRQWKQELLDKTGIPEDCIGEYSGEFKEIRPVTIATYQILTYRPAKDETFPHLKLFTEQDWGIIIYDEVHLLPAPVFRTAAGPTSNELTAHGPAGVHRPCGTVSLGRIINANASS
jgi:DNA excision repair protein ERCC-3